VRGARGYVRNLFPSLPRGSGCFRRPGWPSSGPGSRFPFLVIYLHDVRGISLGLASLVAASNGLAALVSGPIAGAVADRIGARSTLPASLVALAAAFALFPLIREPRHAFLLNGLAGVGSGGFWPREQDDQERSGTRASPGSSR
jgi:MFS family permease